MAFVRKNVKFIFVFVAVLIGSSWYIVKRENDYFTHVNRVTKQFINEMEKQHALSCFSIGGSFPSNIKAIDVKFYCFEKKSIEEVQTRGKYQPCDEPQRSTYTISEK